MANPIAIEMMDLEKDMMNNDVTKILTIKDRPKASIFSLFRRDLPTQILKKIGKNNG